MEERRKSPRVKKGLPIKLKQSPDKDFDISTETKDISASGTYCFVNRPVETMTKLKITLLFSPQKLKPKNIKKINCEGIVVRSEKSNENLQYPYRIAVFFSKIDSKDKKFLQQYVNSLL